ncbi:MAG: peptidylprolyl isomerase, partial [Candidatus Thermoplasmatota archaeon]|nr:peptidylprolyl isomerase [Candidatus Thermoplasmatota archaeon]
MKGRALIVLALVVLAGCTQPEEPQTYENPVRPCGALDPVFQVDNGYNPTAVLQTSKGDVRVAVFANQVPFTAGSFLELVEQDVYDETRFHKLVPGEVVQGGDPFTASDNKNFWGTGGFGYEFSDEFHRSLRHDRVGRVSLVSQGPNGVGSQFAIHLKEAPGLDDRQPVIGQVVSGMGVIREIVQTPTDDRDRPQFDARLNDVRWELPEKDPNDATVVLSSFGYDCHQGTEPGDTAEFLVTVRNTGQRILNGTFEADHPAGWEVSVRNAERIVVPSGQSVAYAIDVETPSDAPL